MGGEVDFHLITLFFRGKLAVTRLRPQSVFIFF